jgi:uncharacterized protein (TIGR02001 family)
MKALSWITNRHVVSALCAAPILLGSAYVSAEDVIAAAPAEAAPPYTLTYNLGVYSNYISRGNDWGDGPALQGGVDWAHSSGFYLGAWFSTTDPLTLGGAGSVTNIAPNNAPLGTGNHVETDWYGGYTHAFGPVTLGIGGNYVWYPEGEKSYHDRNQDTFEGNLNIAAYGFTYTFYHAFTDWYGIGNTRTAAAAGRFPNAAEAAADTSGVEYHEIKYNHELPFAGLNFAAKVGYQRSSDICLNQKDFLIGISRNFSLPTGGKPLDGFTAGANYTDTFDVEECAQVSGVLDGSDHKTSYYTDDNGKVINDSKITFYIKRSW